jgi:hypothetical protein
MSEALLIEVAPSNEDVEFRETEWNCLPFCGAKRNEIDKINKWHDEHGNKCVDVRQPPPPTAA